MPISVPKMDARKRPPQGNRATDDLFIICMFNHESDDEFESIKLGGSHEQSLLLWVSQQLGKKILTKETHLSRANCSFKHSSTLNLSLIRSSLFSMRVVWRLKSSTLSRRLCLLFLLKLSPRLLRRSAHAFSTAKGSMSCWLIDSSKIYTGTCIRRIILRS